VRHDAGTEEDGFVGEGEEGCLTQDRRADNLRTRSACLVSFSHVFAVCDMATTTNSAQKAFPYRCSKILVSILGVGDKIGEGDAYPG
jgi:hypothetical protein